MVYFVVILCISPRFGMLYQAKSGNPGRVSLKIYLTTSTPFSRQFCNGEQRRFLFWKDDWFPLNHFDFKIKILINT
jgi:hypothetical protein